MKNIFLITVILFKIVVCSEIEHLVKNNTKKIVLLGNKTFCFDEVKYKEDQEFIEKINNRSYSLCCTGLSHELIKQEDYEVLHNLDSDFAKNFYIKVKSEPRQFWQDCPECGYGSKENNTRCSMSEWAQNGFLIGTLLATATCVPWAAYAGTLYPATSCTLVPLCTIVSELSNRLHYRFYVKEKTIYFDEKGRESEQVEW